MRAWWTAYGVCAAAATVPLLVTGVLPMADLPEHMALVAVWKHFDDPCHRFAQVFEIQWATPYLFGYAAIRLLALFLSVTAATKAVVWLAVLLTPLSVRALLARGGVDPWLALLAFPLAYGYSFYWGFLNFWAAIPLALFYIALLYDQRPRAVMLSVLGLLLVASHALLFGFCAALTVAVAAIRRKPLLVATLVPAGAALVLFFVRLARMEEAGGTGIEWKWSASRFGELASQLVANAWDPSGLVLAGVMALVLVVSRPALTRDAARWIFAAAAAGAYFLGPHTAFGSGYFHARFAVFFAIAVLFLFDAPRRAPRAARALIVAFVLAWMAFLTNRFQGFGAEAREFGAIVEAIPANRRVALLNVHPFSDHVPGPVFWHFAGHYQARKGGLIAWSFAEHYVPLVRYRAGAAPRLRTRFTRPIDDVDWEGLLRQYDYVVARGPEMRWLFRHAPSPLPLRLRSGSWWLYETPRARMPQRDCPPLGE